MIEVLSGIMINWILVTSSWIIALKILKKVMGSPRLIKSFKRLIGE